VIETLKLAANTGATFGNKSVKGVSVKSSHAATSPAGKTVDPVTEKTPVVEPLNGGNVVQHNGETSDVSQAPITDVFSENDDDAIQSSINGIAATLDLASLNVAPDVLEVIKRCPGVYMEWLSQSIKSVTIPEIVAVTGQSKRRVVYQVGKALKQTSRNENKILVSSVIDWLGSMPMPEQVAVHVVSQNGDDTDSSFDQNSVNTSPDTGEIVVANVVNLLSDTGETAVINSENVVRDNRETVGENYLHLLKSANDDETDKLSITLAAMRGNASITDEELAALLGLKRPASARFWRLKARTVLEQDQELVELGAE
jgi:hypothetical protein